jgi:hypothetical protein
MIRQTLSPTPTSGNFFGAKSRRITFDLDHTLWPTFLPSFGGIWPSYTRGPLTSEQSRMFALNHLGQAWSRGRFPGGIINLSFCGTFNLPETSVNSGYVHPIFLHDRME